VQTRDRRLSEGGCDGYPRTGAHVLVDQKSVPFFKTGKEMRERLTGHSR
jgi:nucleoid DNA-binding protein